jgi:hypothetical protein
MQSSLPTVDAGEGSGSTTSATASSTAKTPRRNPESAQIHETGLTLPSVDARQARSSRSPGVIKVIKSPIPHVYPPVKVYQTTIEHIKERHPHEAEHHLAAIFSTIERPYRVHRSKTHPGGLVLINERVASSRGHPLRVAVKLLDTPEDGREAILQTAHFHKSKTWGALIWQRDSGLVDAKAEGPESQPGP